MITLESKNILLREVNPEYFNDIIRWRNNIDNNRYLNQPFQLTLELQEKWYKKYLKDDTQGLLVAVDKKNNIPFATIGWTDYDNYTNSCIAGRLLVGVREYRGGRLWSEATALFNRYLYHDMNIAVMYAHVVRENIASIKWHLKWGWIKNTGIIKYPKELEVNGMKQEEYIRTREMYNKINKF